MKAYCVSFPHTAQNSLFCHQCVLLLLIPSHCFPSDFSLTPNSSAPDPFVLQLAVGCALHSGEVTEGFLRKAYQGSALLSLQSSSWVPSPQGGSRAQHVCRLLNLFRGLKETVHRLLTVTCPRFLFSLLDTGKADIQCQVRPTAWLSSGPSPGPGRLQLVCHVSGFYPKPIRVMWMHGDKEQLGTWRGGVLPHADGTWYLRVTLEVVAGEAEELSCWVKHSSLEGQEMMLYWSEKDPGSRLERGGGGQQAVQEGQLKI
nr:T-cell surface glycoprotein CD1a [Oryctolagus cuniculus]